MPGIPAGRDGKGLPPAPPKSIWTPVGLHGRGSDVVVGCKSLRSLVDLVRFELTTSSMPWFQNQSLTGSGVENTRLARQRFGPYLDPVRSSMRGLDLESPAFVKHGCGLDLMWSTMDLAHARGRIRHVNSSCRTKKRVLLYCGRPNCPEIPDGSAGAIAWHRVPAATIRKFRIVRQDGRLHGIRAADADYSSKNGILTSGLP
jgi:hypothetical protein